MKPNFSISLIVKQSEKTLPRLLDSLSEFLKSGGEVCVLDTGSTDNTVMIAEKYDCVVNTIGSKFVETIDKELANKVNEYYGDVVVSEGDKYFNFSKARNEADSMASNNMILSLDSDEVLTKFNFEEICKIIDKGIVRKFEHIQIFTHDIEGGSEIEFIQSKFYDKRFYKWENIVHEMLVGSGEKFRLSEDLLRVDHWQNQDTNRSGYLKGLAIDCYLHPEKDRNCHYLAREFFWTGKMQVAIKQLERHLSMNLPPKEYDTTPTHMESMLFMGNAYGLIGQPDKELEWYEKARKLNPDHRNVVIRIAHFYKWHKNIEKSKEYAILALNFPWDEKYGVSKKHFNDEIIFLLNQ